MNAVYQLCGISRQAHFKAVQRLVEVAYSADIHVRSMTMIRKMHPGMGLRTMYDVLRPDGIGRDGFVMLGLQEGFRLKTIEKYTRTTYSTKSNRYGNLLGGMRFNGINQLWTSDITYFFLGDRFYYIVLVMDVYSRRIVGHSLADNMRAENNVAALAMALATRDLDQYNNTLIHHSDKGTQYASDAYTGLLDKSGIRISMCREVYENTHIERLNDTIKNQYLNRWNIQNLKELKLKLVLAIHNYNNLRPHQSIQKMPPIVYEKHLERVAMDDRFKMEIYTIKNNI